MARSYNGSTSKLRVSIGACNFAAPVTLIGLVNFAAARDAAWNGLIVSLTSGGAPQGWGLDRDSSNKVRFLTSGSGGTDTPTSTSSTDGWCLIGVTKASGTVAPRFHRYKYSTGVFLHENFNNTIADGSAPGASGFVELGGDFGGSGDWFQGDAGIWSAYNRVLSDAEFEDLPFTLQAHYSLSPAGLWLLDQEKTSMLVNDLSGGGALESSSVALGISTAHPPIFNITDGVWLPTLVVPSGGGPLVITAVPASLTLAAPVPGVVETANQPPGSLTLSTAPPVAVESAPAPPASLTLSSPTPGLAESAAAPPASLTLSAPAPTPVESAAAPPGSLTLGAAAPAAAETVQAVAAQLNLSAPVPAPALVVNAAAASMALSAPAPGLLETVQAPSARIDLQAPTPTVQSGALIVSPPPASLTLSAPAPTPAEQVSAAAGQISLSAASPSARGTATAPAASLTLSAPAPSLRASVTAAPGSLTLSSPAASLKVTVAAAPATITLSVAAPTLSTLTGPTIAALVTIGCFATTTAALREFATTHARLTAFASVSATLSP